ncbi:MAG: LysM peptidoglycan-binding domain-containing protein [Nitrospirae bacterium]|nr:MAG: LysM peptidoglycan-binding domain-containing protein [Nitrospirota bacterium]
MKKYLSLIIFFAVMLVCSSSYAGLTYTVKKGDNLDRIAKKHSISVKAIMSANDMQSAKLHIGMKIVIPSTKHETKKTTKEHLNTTKQTEASADKISAKNTSNASGEDQIHIVKKGDTIQSVARKYSVQASEIKKLNGIKSGKIKSGTLLIVKRGAPKQYTVKKGDNIWRIAKKFNKNIDELKEINGMSSNSLKPGQVIKLIKNKEEHTEDIADIKEELRPVLEAYADKVRPNERIREVKEISKSEDLLSIGIADRLILFAKKMLNLPYKFGGNGSIGLDCSSYVQKVFEIAGVTLPRSARQQFTFGEPVEKDQLSKGDLVFFKTYASFPSHVGIYLGNNLFIHASTKSKRITIDSLEAPYYVKRYIGAKRLLEEEKANLFELSVTEKEL